MDDIANFIPLNEPIAVIAPNDPRAAENRRRLDEYEAPNEFLEQLRRTFQDAFNHRELERPWNWAAPSDEEQMRFFAEDDESDDDVEDDGIEDVDNDVVVVGNNAYIDFDSDDEVDDEGYEETDDEDNVEDDDDVVVINAPPPMNEYYEILRRENGNGP